MITQEFPKVMYHATEQPKAVASADEQSALGGEWFTSPADVKSRADLEQERLLAEKEAAFQVEQDRIAAEKAAHDPGQDVDAEPTAEDLAPAKPKKGK